MSGYTATVDSTVELLRVFGDATRVRLLALLAREELSVVELTAITDLPQSRVSTHLARLRDAGLLRDRKVGASTFYALNDKAMPDGARSVWEIVARQVSDTVIDADRARCQRLRRASREKTSWPDSIAGEMERHYSPGRTWEATARGLLGFIALGDVLDVGSGDGAIAELLASRARTITCVDVSDRVVAAARARLSRIDNVRVIQSDMHALEVEDDRFDQVLLLNALTYADEPARVLAECARVLRPGGTISLVTLGEHSHADVTSAYGHVQAGFETREIRRWLSQAGLEVRECAVTSRERKKPYFDVITAFAEKPKANGTRNGNGKRKRHG